MFCPSCGKEMLEGTRSEGYDPVTGKKILKDILECPSNRKPWWSSHCNKTFMLDGGKWVELHIYGD